MRRRRKRRYTSLNTVARRHCVVRTAMVARHCLVGTAGNLPVRWRSLHSGVGMLAIRAVRRNIVDRRSARLERARRPECALVVLESRFAASAARDGTGRAPGSAAYGSVLGSLTPGSASE